MSNDENDFVVFEGYNSSKLKFSRKQFLVDTAQKSKSYRTMIIKALWVIFLNVEMRLCTVFLEIEGYRAGEDEIENGGGGGGQWNAISWRLLV